MKEPRWARDRSLSQLLEGRPNGQERLLARAGGPGAVAYCGGMAASAVRQFLLPPPDGHGGDKIRA